jgi:hypothetical protein
MQKQFNQGWVAEFLKKLEAMPESERPLVLK